MTGPPSSPQAINNDDDAQKSAQVCLPLLLNRMRQPNPPSAILVACYSDHPLVRLFNSMVSNISKVSNAPTLGLRAMGILEASVIKALESIQPNEKFGIITTGKDWEPLLSQAVISLLGESNRDRFAGVIGTGLGVLEFHGGDPTNVEKLMAQAAVELTSRGATAICLGCAGMSGLHSNLWNAVNEKDKPEKVKVIDGVIAGVQLLQD